MKCPSIPHLSWLYYHFMGYCIMEYTFTLERKERIDMTGRPSKYKAEYADQAYKFCLLGATDARLGELFEVDEATIHRWKIAHEEFCKSIKRGKDIADAEIAQALFHRAKGYSHQAVKIFNNQGEIITEEYTEHYPPDTGAAMAWLKNRQPKQWRDKQEIEHSGTISVESMLESL